MLLQFKFKNFKCFYDETTLDLTATYEKRHLENTLSINGNNILPLIAIHGANASGKSSILEALDYMFSLIKYSHRLDIHNDFNVNPFLLSKKSIKENSEFEISLYLNDYEYRYGFCINPRRISEEWLYCKKFSSNTKASQKTIFERDKNNITFGKPFKQYEKIWNLFGNSLNDSNKLLILTSIALKEDCGIFRDLYNYISKFDFKIESEFEKNSINILSENNKIYNNLEKILKEFDPCLHGIKIEKVDNTTEDKYNISGIHNNIDNDLMTLIPLHKESNGTIKIFSIMPTILKNLQDGGIICIDELDVKLHPLLYKKIVNMYMDKNINKNNSQLIYTAHSTYLFNSSDLRRDQLYLVEKNNQGKSSLYSLSEFRNLRTDADYEKKYLSGQFGGIPYNNL